MGKIRVFGTRETCGLGGIPGFAVEGGSGKTDSTGKEEAFSTVDAGITMRVFVHAILDCVGLTTVQQVTSTNHSGAIICNQIISFFTSDARVGMGIKFDTILNCSCDTKPFITQVISRDAYVAFISEEVS
jgi:hypothetical protein